MTSLKEILGEEKFREYMTELSKLGVAKRKKYFSEEEKKAARKKYNKDAYAKRKEKND